VGWVDILCHSDAGCAVFLPAGICNSLWCFMPGVFAMEVLPISKEITIDDKARID